MVDFGVDSRPANVLTFCPNEHADLTSQLNEFAATIADADTHRLAKNYYNLQFNNFPIVTMYKRNNKVVGFATCLDRPSFYPSGSIRILNRFYQSSTDCRVNYSRELLRPTTFHCVMQQLILAAKLGYKNGFISRDSRASGFFKNFVNALDKQSTYSWEYQKGPFLVAPDPSNIECWQSIGLVQFDSNNNNFWNHWRTS